MIEQALSWLKANMLANAQCTMFHPAPEPADQYYIRNPQGEYELVQSQPQPRAVSAIDMASLAAIANQPFDPTVVTQGRRAVFLSPTSIDFAFDWNRPRRELASLALVNSDEWSVISTWSTIEGKEFQQDELRHLLLGPLFNAIPSGSNIIKQISNLNFQQINEKQRHIDHGSESIGKSIQAQVKAPGTDFGLPPESITFNVRRYGNPDIAKACRVRVAIEVNALDESITLTPTAADMTNCQADCLGYIAQFLDEKLKVSSVPLVLGGISTAAPTAMKIDTALPC